MHLTAKELSEGTRGHRVGDFVYLPSGEPFTRGLTRFVYQMIERKCYPPRLAELAKRARRDTSCRYPFWAEIEMEYRELVEQATIWDSFDLDETDRVPLGDPCWLEPAPPEAIAYLQWVVGIHGAYGDPWQIAGFPRTGLFYTVADDGIVKDVAQAFDLFRLSGIHQLGTLTDPIALSSGRPTIAFRYQHTRYVHSLDVAAIGNLILHNTNIPTDEARHALVAMLIHDVLTPAHGDGTKLLDPELFDEDKHIGDVLSGKRWQELKTKYDLNRNLIIKMVQERHRGGQIKDLADKIAYTARDVEAFIIHRPGILAQHHLKEPKEHQQIRRLLKRSPHLCGVWDTWQIHEGRLYAQDASRLYDFLKLRVLMHQGLYLNPFSRYREFVFSNVIVRYLYETGRVTHRDLLDMTDRGLDAMIEGVIDRPAAMDDMKVLGNPHAEAFASVDEAMIRARTLREQGTDFVFVENLRRRIKPGVDLLVSDGGKIVPLSDAYPAEANELTRLAQINKPVRVYYLTDPNVSPEFLSAYRAYEARSTPA